jgi:hypothetical protein
MSRPSPLFLSLRGLFELILNVDSQALNRGGINLDAPPKHQFFNISISKGVSKIPIDGLQDDTFGKRSFFKSI